MSVYITQMKTHSREDVTELVGKLHNCIIHQCQPQILKIVAGRRKETSYIAVCKRDGCGKIGYDVAEVVKYWNTWNPASGSKPELLSNTQWEILTFMAVHGFHLLHRPAAKIVWQLCKDGKHEGFGYKEASVLKLVSLGLIDKHVVNSQVAEYLITKDGYTFLKRENVIGK